MIEQRDVLLFRAVEEQRICEAAATRRACTSGRPMCNGHRAAVMPLDNRESGTVPE